MNEIEVVAEALGLDEDDAFLVLALCDLLDQEDAVADYGYAKDTPRGRDLVARVADSAYRARLHTAAVSEGLPARVIAVLAENM